MKIRRPWVRRAIFRYPAQDFAPGTSNPVLTLGIYQKVEISERSPPGTSFEQAKLGQVFLDRVFKANPLMLAKTVEIYK